MNPTEDPIPQQEVTLQNALPDTEPQSQSSANKFDKPPNSKVHRPKDQGPPFEKKRKFSMIPEEPSFEYAKFNLKWENLRISIKKTGTTIIPNFSGSLQSGSLVAILGASGSGKTTFMNYISGYTRGDLEADCTLKMNGVRMTNIKALKRISGYVFQEDVLIPELTVYETLWYNAK
jgi:ABC-type multidrug transport system fused ATPase/permease subunit